MSEASNVEWVRSGTQKPDTLVTTSALLSGMGKPIGIRLAPTAAAEAGELPEGYARSPLLYICLDRHVSEACYAGKWTRRLFEPGDITITPAGMPVAYRWYGPNRGVLVELELDTFPAPPGIMPSFAGKDPLITHMTLALRDELGADNPGGRIYSDMLGAALKAHFVRKHGVHVGPPAARNDLPRKHLAAVLDYISAHLHEPISLMDLAARLQAAHGSAAASICAAETRRAGDVAHAERRGEARRYRAALRVQQPEPLGDRVPTHRRDDSRGVSGAGPERGF